MAAARRDGPKPAAVTTTDLLKAAGLVFVLADHVGLFFDANEDWWRVLGRLAAPIFFFLIGYARTRQVPATWIALGLALTAIDAFTGRKGGGAIQANILLVFVLLRLVLGPIEREVAPVPWRLALLVGATLSLARPLAPYLEYGMEGFLWAYLGLAQRMAGEAPGREARLRALALGLVAAVAYVTIETVDLEFEGVEAASFALLTGGLLLVLLAFRRSALARRPPAATAFRFAGRYSLEIYAATLAALQIAAFLSRHRS